jgi:hypothetical protein
MIHSALIAPRSIASNNSIAFKPGAVAIAGVFQKLRTRSTSAGRKSR